MILTHPTKICIKGCPPAGLRTISSYELGGKQYLVSIDPDTNHLYIWRKHHSIYIKINTGPIFSLAARYVDKVAA